MTSENSYDIPGLNQPIQRIKRGGPIPIAPTQGGLLHWILARPPSATLNFGFSAAIEGELDIEVMQRSVAQLVARHEALRSRFVVSDGGTMQQIDEPPASPLTITDLRSHGAEASAEAHRMFIAGTRRPFDIMKEHGSRWALTRIGDRSNRLSLIVHQIWCGPMEIATVLFPELVAIYDAHVAGRTPDIPERPLQFADYTTWLRAWSKGAGAPIVERWRRRFADAKPLAIPTDRPRESRASVEAETVQFDLPTNITKPFDLVCRDRRVPPTAIFLCAFAASLARRAKQTDAVIGIVTETRTLKPELTTVIGKFLNPVLSRLDLGGAPTCRELLSRARVALVESHRHRIVPTELVVDDPSTLDSPLLRVMMNVISQPPTGSPCFGGTKTALEWYQTDECKNELVLSAHRASPDLWKGSLTAARSSYDRATVESMISDFVRCMTAIVLHPDTKLGTVDGGA